MPELSLLLQPLEHAIRQTFIPALIRRPINDAERELLSLPARYGGMGILNPSVECSSAHSNSNLITQPLIRLILRQESDFDPIELEKQLKRFVKT